MEKRYEDAASRGMVVGNVRAVQVLGSLARKKADYPFGISKVILRILYSELGHPLDIVKACGSESSSSPRLRVMEWVGRQMHAELRASSNHPVRSEIRGPESFEP